MFLPLKSKKGDCLFWFGFNLWFIIQQTATKNIVREVKIAIVEQ